MNVANPYMITLLKRPYDASYECDMSMYDKLPYYMDKEVCSKEYIRLISGNHIKYYRCQLKDARKIDTHDEQFNEILSTHKYLDEKKKADEIRRHSHYAKAKELAASTEEDDENERI